MHGIVSDGLQGEPFLCYSRKINPYWVQGLGNGDSPHHEMAVNYPKGHFLFYIKSKEYLYGENHSRLSSLSWLWKMCWKRFSKIVTEVQYSGYTSLMWPSNLWLRKVKKREVDFLNQIRREIVEIDCWLWSSVQCVTVLSYSKWQRWYVHMPTTSGSFLFLGGRGQF